MAIHVTEETVGDIRCPSCNRKKLKIEVRMVAKPLGSHSLSGTQMKVSARQWPYLICTNCSFTVAAKSE